MQPLSIHTDMRFLRTGNFVKALAVCTALSVLTLLWAPAQGTSDVEKDYRDWLRAQVDGEVDASFDEALDRAHDSQPHSLGDFLKAFADAYEQLQPEASLASVFAAPELPLDALLALLQSRTGGASVDGLSPRTLMLQTSTTATASVDRLVSAQLTTKLSPSPMELRARQQAYIAATLIVIPLRTLFSARPMAP